MWSGKQLRRLIILSFAIAIQAKEPELPLCPTNVQFFPQNLPMHCRMPGTIPPFIPPGYQNPLLGKQPEGIPNPLPGLAGSVPVPMPGPLPMPMMPMPQAPAQKLPVIVMPFYSPEPSAKNLYSSHPGKPPKKRRPYPHKKHRPRPYYNSEEETDTGSSIEDSTDTSSERSWWRTSKQGRRSNHHHRSRKKYQNKEILTPILQYVTKDGYVIFEKQISKGEAKDWMVAKNEERNNADATRTRKEDLDSDEHRNEKNKKSFMNDAEELEIKTEVNPQPLKKRLSKRKPVRSRPEE